MKFRSLGVLLMIVALFTLPIKATAQVQGLQIAPAIKDIQLTTDSQNADFQIIITNHTSQVAELEIEIVDFGTLDQSGGIAFLGSESSKDRPYSLAPWASADKPTLKVLPESKDQLTVTIRNDISLAPGGHYGAVQFKLLDQRPDILTGPSKVNLRQVFASLIFVNKAGGDTYDLSIDNFTHNAKWWRLPTETEILIKNHGNVHDTPEGQLTITDSRGKIVSETKINQEAGRVLPGSSRLFKIPISRSALTLWPGKYKLTAEITYHRGLLKQTKQLYVTIVPSLLLLTLIALMLAGLAILLVTKKTNKHNLLDKIAKLMLKLTRSSKKRA